MTLGPISSPDEYDGLIALLDEQDIEAIVIGGESHIETISSEALPHIALLELASMSAPDIKLCLQQCAQLKLRVIGLVPRELVSDMDVTLNLDDFVLLPVNADELIIRARQVLWRNRSEDNDDTIRIGDLTINPTTYEVSLKGRRINLRFKEYELLRLLAMNPGRVYTRDTLLSQIWGYDYFGGTRTVDVHIRRLRSKIEDAEHSFIETIWNVGYRFKDFRQPSQ